MSFLTRMKRHRKKQSRRSQVEPIDLTVIDDTASSSSSSSTRRISPRRSPLRKRQFNLRSRCFSNMELCQVWQLQEQCWTFHFIYLATETTRYECDLAGLLFIYSGPAVLHVDGVMHSLMKDDTYCIAESSIWRLSWKRDQQLVAVRAVFIVSEDS